MNQYDISEFPREVADEIQYYVYRLIDPRNGETFYVGKGKGNRVFQHMKGAVESLESETDDEVSAKIQTIREIIRSGLHVIHVIHRHGMDEKTAFEVEAALIDAYPGTTNIAGGSGSGEYGPMNAIEIINKYRAEEAQLSHRVLMIIINKTIDEQSIYNATRFAWKLDVSKAQRAEYVLAVTRGIIVEVFRPLEWKSATIANFPEFNYEIPARYGFIGTPAEPEIRKMYTGKKIPEAYRRKGAANPIRYSY